MEPEIDFEALYREERNKRIKAEELQSKAENEASLYKSKYEKSIFITQSKTSIYQKFINEGVVISSETKFPNLNDETIKKTWKLIVESKEIPAFGQGTDEKKQVHPLIDKVLQEVLQKFSNSKLKHHKEATLRCPDFIPDFILTSKETAHPGWLESYGFVECKAFKTGSELLRVGGGQAISYLATSMNLRDDIRTANVFKFSAVTDGRRIQFFFCNNHNLSGTNKIYSTVLELIPDTLNFEVPPLGFETLCQLVKLTADSNFPNFKIKVGGAIGTINQVYQRSEDIIVASVAFPGDLKHPCLVKQAINNNKSATFSLRKEVMMYKMFKNTPVKTLKLSQRCSSDCLVLDEIGITLKSWSQDVLFRVDEDKDDGGGGVSDENEIIKQRKFIDCIVKVFDQIRLLHEQGFTHGDIRPANIIVLEETNEPYLIDFVTATRIGETLQFIHGTVMYMSDEVLKSEAPFVFKPIYDLEAFAFTILDCIENGFFNTFLLQIADKFTAENDSIEAEYCENRSIALGCLQNDMGNDPEFRSKHFPYLKLVSIFFVFLNRLQQIPKNDFISKEDYDELRETLSL